METSLRTVETNGITMSYREAGSGPLVVLLHGFPELGYSYRHQIKALADAGYHAVAPDQRGYGRTDAPADIADYSLLHLAGDIIGLVRALGDERFVVVGHDWGSPVASALGLFRPVVVAGVALLSVPYAPRGDVDSLTGLTKLLGPANYQQYFQAPGVAEAAFEKDVRASMVSTLVGLSGDSTEVATLTDGGATGIGRATGDGELPPWLTEADVDFFVGEFSRSGWRGGLNWYRNSVPNWEMMAAWHRAPLLPPSLFVGGDRDPVLNWPGFRDMVDHLRESSMPNLTKAVVLEGCGHWIQQERPREINELLVEFLHAINY